METMVKNIVRLRIARVLSLKKSRIPFFNDGKFPAKKGKVNKTMPFKGLIKTMTPKMTVKYKIYLLSNPKKYSLA